MRCARPCTPIPPLHACSMLTRWTLCRRSLLGRILESNDILHTGVGSESRAYARCRDRARAREAVARGCGRSVSWRAQGASVPPSLESCGGGSRSVVHVHGLRPAAFAERLSCAMSVGLAASARICMYGADVGLACRRPCESYAASAEHTPPFQNSATVIVHSLFFAHSTL